MNGWYRSIPDYEKSTYKGPLLEGCIFLTSAEMMPIVLEHFSKSKKKWYKIKERERERGRTTYVGAQRPY